MVIATLSGCTSPLGNFEYVGDKDPVTVPKTTHTIVILDFKIAVGSIALEVNPTATNLAYVENKVSIREGSGKELKDAEDVSYSEVDTNTMRVLFDSKDEGIRVDIGYDITIKVNHNISLQINLETSTGDITTSISDATMTVSALDLSASTGDVSLTLNNVKFTDPSPKVETSTGDHDISLTKVNYSTSTTWDISMSTGSTDLTLTDPNAPGTASMTHKFGISSSTGSITVSADLHQDYGIKVAATVSTGTIILPDDEETDYTSGNFNTATQKYDFVLSTSTGNITFTLGG